MNAEIPFIRNFDFAYGKIERLSPMIRRIVANNPNFFTFYGTNTYFLGNGDVALIDPGPDTQEHIDAIMESLAGEVITHILITHTHFDHWPAYQSLQKAYGAQTYGYYAGNDLDISRDQDLTEARILSNQERFDMTEFIPDHRVVHGDVIKGNGWSIECVFTPGHASNHMCYQLREEKTLFTGDHVMGWSTSVISPPSGDMEKYMSSLDLLLHRDDMRYWPAHGPGISNTRNFVESFILHRKEREEQILDQLAKGAKTIPDMVSEIYRDVPNVLHPAAERSVLAAIIYMVKKGAVVCNGEASVSSEFFLR